MPRFISMTWQLPRPLSRHFAALSQFIDPNGKLHFEGKACIDGQGVDFKNGTSYRINMAELTLVGVLGKGQYGIVQLPLKEIMLELDELKMSQIIMELQVLHSSHHPNIIDFYGAFFIENCVYMCIEYMDGGSLDKLYGAGIPENILGMISLAVIEGLYFLKSTLSIIHRDVKPTNILVNTLGHIKLCDFGVSGQLIQSHAKTNIGCQSYMAPERIISRNSGKYTARSDLNAIVSSDSPTLPAESFSPEARDFVAKCLVKDPKSRPTYPKLLATPWLQRFKNSPDDGVGEWVKKTLQSKKKA
ncbi:hypothetical protein BASA62_005707 [Batrachochytrium salamandrivorans]|nr:hypothetical protein BASA62_005707 [Batrachochytrium salamandrivorans]